MMLDGRPCRACAAPLVFIPTPNDKTIPCDAAVVWAYPHPDPHHTVAVTVVTDAGEVTRGVRCEPRTIGAVAGRVPHWATCPDADRFRAKPAAPPRPRADEVALRLVWDELEKELERQGATWTNDERGLVVTPRPSKGSPEALAVGRLCAAIRALAGLEAGQWQPAPPPVKTGGGEP